MDAERRRDDEVAEITLRILVRLYDAWPNPSTVSPNAVYRPAARYTGPNDALFVMRQVLGRTVTGGLGGCGLTGARLEPAMRARLDEVDDSGAPWIARIHVVLAEATMPRLGHATDVLNGLMV